jgi:hypothetical protein
MAPLDHFFEVPFPCDAGAVLQNAESQRQFGWDYAQWRQVPRRRDMSPWPSSSLSMHSPARLPARPPPFRTQFLQLHDENPADMQVLRSGDLDSGLPQRVVVISAISYFGQLIQSNPLASARLALLDTGGRSFFHLVRAPSLACERTHSEISYKLTQSPQLAWSEKHIE